MTGFPVFLSAILALIFLLSRWGLENPVPDSALRAFALAVVFLGIPDLLHRRFSRTVWWNSLPALSLLGLAFLSFGGWCCQRWGISAIGGVYLLAVLVLVLQFRLPPVSLSPTLILWILFAGWCAGVLWGNPFFNSPIFFELLALKKIGGDFLSSVGPMRLFETYGVATTGMDGVIAIPYHYGGRWILLRFANLVGLGADSAYALIYPVVFVPFFFQHFLGWIQQLRRGKPMLPVHWGILVVGFTGILPWKFATQLIPPSYGWNRLFTSDTYTIAAGILFAVFRIATIPGAAASPGFLFLGLPALLALAAAVKISTGAMLLAFMGYLFLRQRLYKNRLACGSFMICLVVELWSLSWTYTSVPLQIVPLHILRTWVRPDLWLFFWTSHFFYSGLALALFRGIRFETVLFFSVVGALPGLWFSIPDANAIFFSCDQEWIALAFLVAAFEVDLIPKTLRRPAAILASVVFLFSLQNLIGMAIRLRFPAHLGTPNPRSQQISQLRQLTIADKKNTALFIPRANRAYWEMTECETGHTLATALTGVALIEGQPNSDCPGRAYGYQYFGKADKLPWDRSDTEICNLAGARGFKHVLKIENLKQIRILNCLP